MKTFYCLKGKADQTQYILGELAIFIAFCAWFIAALAQIEPWPIFWQRAYETLWLSAFVAIVYTGFALHIARLRDAGYYWWAIWVWPCAWLLRSKW